ncbi:MAG: efflux RND transporter periplasmic adaptor subunit [Rhodospirillales bacterium]|nr:efflux RND transporter periplasmic adaptor subunit [Alphaproteobacteria bacterium]MCB1838865.1 efflux RND transporter periplasmic adaptor subunit [Alphaproteobacteria bacterium]MCB9977103.1 efflux RND transporter periplasmic adaptor subunit [Rhodospirillales bacterium]
MAGINKKYLYPVLGLLAVVILMGSFWTVTKPKAYEIAKVEKGKAVEAVYATATVEPVTWAAIAPIMTGRITEINVQEGDQVKTGEVLARLDDSDIRAQLDENRALETFYKAEVERAEKLIKTGALSEDKYDQRKTNLTQSRARIDMLEQQIRQLALTAPMDGTVLWRDVELGEVKEAGKPLFWVGRPLPLRLEAEVDEEDIPKIKSGQTVLITADAFPGEVMEGLLHWVSPKGDPVNKSYRVYVSLPEDTKLMIGMTVETNAIVQEKDGALLAPAGAVTGDGYVWRAESRGGKRYSAHKIPVKAGIHGEKNIEILEGVKEGDVLILPPFDDLQDGITVQARSK